MVKLDEFKKPICSRLLHNFCEKNCRKLNNKLIAQQNWYKIYTDLSFLVIVSPQRYVVERWNLFCILVTYCID